MLRDIPVLGGSVFTQPLPVYVGLVLVAIIGWALRRTTIGLEIRAAGERPDSLDAAGVSVVRTRAIAEMTCGFLAGVGGAYLAIVSAGTFVPLVTNGRGFIAIVIAMLARGRPWWVVGGALLFGMSLSATTALQLIGVDIPIDAVRDAAVRLGHRGAGAVRTECASAVGAGSAVPARKPLMHLTDEFTITTPPDRAFASLLDLELVAPCVPGAELGAMDAGRLVPGHRVGEARAHEVRVQGQAADRGAGRGRADRGHRGRGPGDRWRRHGEGPGARWRSCPKGTGSRVRMTTDLDIKGRAAQMGAGIIGDVSRKLVGEAATCIEARLSAPRRMPIPSTLPVGGSVGGVGLMASVMTARLGDSLRRLGRRGERDATPDTDTDSREA